MHSRLVDAHGDALAIGLHHRATQPVARADADRHLAADLLARLGERGARFLLELGAGDHHGGRRAGDGVVLPRPPVDVAARPAVHAIAVAPVVYVGAFIALALPYAAPPHVHPEALLAVVYEIALIAIAVGPGLHALAVLAPGFEPAAVIGDAAGTAFAFGEPVDARPFVAALQLRIEYAAALGLSRGANSNEAQKKREGDGAFQSRVHFTP